MIIRGTGHTDQQRTVSSQSNKSFVPLQILNILRCRYSMNNANDKIKCPDSPFEGLKVGVYPICVASWIQIQYKSEDLQMKHLQNVCAVNHYKFNWHSPTKSVHLFSMHESNQCIVSSRARNPHEMDKVHPLGSRNVLGRFYDRIDIPFAPMWVLCKSQHRSPF